MAAGTLRRLWVVSPTNSINGSGDIEAGLEQFANMSVPVVRLHARLQIANTEETLIA